jgi:uncharacterized protein YegL
MNLENIEFVVNPEPRCPVVLLLDTSGSMSGEPINQLNQGIATFKQEIEQDTTASLRVEVAIITFGGSVQVAQDFVTIDQFEPTKLTPMGNTPMGKAIELALEQLENRKAAYKNNGVPYYQPWVLLITDGAPTDNWQAAALRVRLADAAGKLSFFTVGVTGANMEILGEIAPPRTPPAMLDGLKYQELFCWLSASMKRVSCNNVGSGMITLPPAQGWMQINT